LIPLQHPVSTREDVRSTLESVFARDEFGEHRSWIAEQWVKLFDQLSEWFRDLFGIVDPAVNALLVKVLLGLLAAAILAAIAVRILRWARGRAPAVPPQRAEGRRAASVAALRAEARAAAARGDRVAALRLLFRALVLGLSQRGELEYRDAWTNRELLERGAPPRDVAPVLAALVPRLDAQSFGHEPAVAEDVERLAALCDRFLGRVPS